MCASPRTMGLCIRANRPLNRLGKRHASLSSGGRSPPRRANALKFFVMARETTGPPSLNEVYVMAYCFCSSSHTILGSSSPHFSSLLVWSARIVGFSSITQFVRPSLLLAHVRWENPRSSSTRFKRSTSPFTSTAAGLNTELIGYGQFSVVRMGFPSYRRNNVAASFSLVNEDIQISPYRVFSLFWDRLSA